MIDDNLRILLGQLIEERLKGKEDLYESYFSGVNDVKQFFYTVADLLKTAGFSDEEVLDVYRKQGGNYLLGKKYGISPRSFADSVIENKNKQE